MEKMSKSELKDWARIFYDVLGQGKITFSSVEGGQMTVTELCDRIRPLDRQLADKVAAWHSAATDLGSYVAERLNEHNPPGVLIADRVNPLAVDEDFFLPLPTEPKGFATCVEGDES